MDSLAGRKETEQEMEEDHRPDTTLMGAIFTTANLWATDADLGESDLRTGNIDSSKIHLQPRDWLYYQYPVSPGLKHSAERGSQPREFADLLEVDYLRTIAIVNAGGIGSFFDSFWDWQHKPRELGWRP